MFLPALALYQHSEVQHAGEEEEGEGAWHHREDMGEVGRDRVEVGRDRVEAGRDRVEGGRDRAEVERDRTEAGRDRAEDKVEVVEEEGPRRKAKTYSIAPK